MGCISWMNLKQFKSKMLVSSIHVHFMLIKMEHHETPNSTTKGQIVGFSLFQVNMKIYHFLLSN
jgi:hypothetical protein